MRDVTDYIGTRVPKPDRERSLIVIAANMIERFICPACGGRPLRLEVDEVSDGIIVEGSLGCPDCKRWHRIRDDIPTLMPPELAASLRAAGERWEEWREQMSSFILQRERDGSVSDEAARRADAKRAMHERFIAFCDFPQDEFACIDIGSGSGHIADLLAEPCDYLGIDPLPAGRAPGSELPTHIPRPSRPVTLIQGVGERLPLVDDCFDAAIIAGTLAHCRSPEELLAETLRVLRSGGTLGLMQETVEEDEGIGGRVRSLVSKLTGGDSDSRGQVRLHSFTSSRLLELLCTRFDCEKQSADESGRQFLRATAPEM